MAAEKTSSNLGSAFSSLKGDKLRLEVQLGVTSFAAAYLYVWAFQDLLGLHLKLVAFDLFLKAPLISLVAFPLVFYGYVKADPLQRSHYHWPAVRFFQAEFPSLYILHRCERCIERVHCRNFISPESGNYTTYWLRDLWRPVFRNQHPEEFKNTFRRGYTCKLLFGTKTLAITFLLIGAITVLAAAGKQFIYARLSKTQFHVPLRTPHLIFLGGCLLVWFAISRLNIPDPTYPTGCWQAWREINRGHVLWLRHNEELLVEVICHAGGNDKTFHEA